MSDAVDIAPGIRQLDTLLGGMDQLTAGFLIDGPMPRGAGPLGVPQSTGVADTVPLLQE